MTNIPADRGASLPSLELSPHAPVEHSDMKDTKIAKEADDTDPTIVDMAMAILEAHLLTSSGGKEWKRRLTIYGV